jgi:glutathione synthase/RimK-type ligase-like ATP-grasp enzyme
MLLPLENVRSVVRFGSTTPLSSIITDRMKRINNKIIEINTETGVLNSSNKRLMGQCFEKAVSKEFLPKTLFNVENSVTQITEFFENKFPLIIKHIYGSRNEKNFLIQNEDELKNFVTKNRMNNYIIQKYYSYSKEYRLHITENGCFYTCRKMLKNDAEKRWFRNDSNSVWILEENELFDKPSCWKLIEETCVKCLKSLGLDVAAFDIRVQSKPNKKGELKFIIIESNSAPSFAEITLTKYVEQIPKLIEEKWKKSLYTEL